MRLVGYIRVSRVGSRKGDSFISPKDQREQIEQYAATHGHQVVEWFEDMDESGGKASRPQFDRALERVDRGAADGLIVLRLNRFMRSLVDALHVIKRIEDSGGQLISVSENIDATTSSGRLSRNQFLSFAEYEREQRAENWTIARRHAVARGVHPASRTPTGYRRREDKRLEPDPVAAPVVAELFRRRAKGEGWTALAKFMDASGIVGPYGNKSWTHGAVQKLIRNRAYLGEARSGEFLNEDAHDALVPEKVWLAANHKQTPANPGHKKRETALLTGLIRCEGCRYLMKSDTMRARDGSRLGLYRCRKHHASGKCDACANVLARVLEPFVEAQVLAALGPDSVLAEAEAFAALAEAQEAQRGLDEARAELEAFLELNEPLMRTAPDIYARKLDEKTSAVARAERDLASAEQLSGLPVFFAGGTIELRWDELSTAERRQLLSALVDCVVVCRGREPISERVTILWRGQAPTELPRRGSRLALRSFTPDELRVTSAEDVKEGAPELLTSAVR